MSIAFAYVDSLPDEDCWECNICYKLKDEEDPEESALPARIIVKKIYQFGKEQSMGCYNVENGQYFIVLNEDLNKNYTLT